VDREQAKALLPIITAYAEGKTIQFLSIASNNWETSAGYSFAESVDRYRIKPEPKEWWIAIDCDGEEYTYPSLKDAEEDKANGSQTYAPFTIYHVREVEDHGSQKS
jgi:hypothetical protein